MFRNFYNVPAAVVLEPFEDEIKEAAVAVWKITLYHGEKVAAIIADLFEEKFIVNYQRKNFDMERLSQGEAIDAWNMGKREYEDKGRDYVNAHAYLAIIDYRETTEGKAKNA